MSTINTPTTSSNSPFVYQTPSEAFAAGAWGKHGKKPAEKQQNFAGSSDKEAAAESLLDLGNADILKVVQDPLKNPIENATMKGVITSPEATNPIKRINNRKKDKDKELVLAPRDHCRVVTIDGIAPADISVDQIRSFASRMGIKGLQRVSKKKIFDAIADEKDNPTKKQKVEDSLSKNHVNWKRYFNVLFSNEIQPKLAMRGE